MPISIRWSTLMRETQSIPLNLRIFNFYCKKLCKFLTVIRQTTTDEMRAESEWMNEGKISSEMRSSNYLTSLAHKKIRWVLKLSLSFSLLLLYYCRGTRWLWKESEILCLEIIRRCNKSFLLLSAPTSGHNIHWHKLSLKSAAHNTLLTKGSGDWTQNIRKTQKTIKNTCSLTTSKIIIEKKGRR